ncbi:hypothetical protein RB653_008065 [Dictyostelium firmibasis]|uniref:DNA mismatch repair protein S5 domain-containing protein n=1 Tax=Dictyostelium firmibasis TaxID=79012 RepID=A0AAN7TZS4_9MYCE
MDFLKSLPLLPTDGNSTSSTSPTTTNNVANESKKKIHRLTQEVVNKISAGEVIQRPSNALKELLENCLDAKSTTITVTVKDGGMKFLQIQDNGTGIRLEDMGIVCERFTTSKLTKFEDLRSIQSFGFRGEALSSISHVSHLKILTKTADSSCAYRACYLNGKLTPASPNEQSSDPKPCAGVNGTQITVEDLFFNTPSRKNVLKNTIDEHSRIALLMKKYAINNPTVSFILKKQGDPTPEVHTSGGQNSLEKDVIGSLYGTDLSKELKIISIDPNSNISKDGNDIGNTTPSSTLSRLDFTMKGFFSSTNYNAKKINFILFINGRLVDSKNLKTGLEQVYGKYLPKGTHPFIFIRLLVPPKNIDVNIHPTKSEVKILHEEQIIEFIQQKVDQELSISSNSKTFSTQVLLPGFDQDNTSQKKQKNSQTSSTQTKSANNNNNNNSATRKEPPEYAKDKIRSDSKSQTLDAFLNPMDYNDNDNNNNNNNDDNNTVGNDSGIGLSYDDGGKFNDNLIFNDNGETPRDIDDPSIATPIKPKQQANSTTTTTTTKSNSPASKNDIKKLQEHTFITPRRTRKYKQVELTSIKSLISDFQLNVHDGLKEFFNDCVFVGCLDHSYALVQFGKKLYLINLENITKELFYQLSLLRFSDFDSIKFSQPLSVYSLLLVSLDSPLSGWMESDGPKEKIADYLTKLLISKKELLNEYFAIEINDDGEIVGIPQVLDHYVPCTDNLPIFLLKLATEVEWEFEKECFSGILKEISSFFKIEPSFLKLRDTLTTVTTTNNNNINFIKKDGKEWVIQHLIFPAFRKLSPPKKFANDGSVIQITTLDNLYKVFERC